MDRFLSSREKRDSQSDSDTGLLAERQWRRQSRVELGRAVDRKQSTGIPFALHLGAGPINLNGWINTDRTNHGAHMYYLDAAERFPFNDGTVDCVYSEHMIEHMSFVAGFAMLKECYRVLRVGGRVRIATPDLERIVSLYGNTSEDAVRYRSWASGFNGIGLDTTVDCHLINNFMRAWGHTFIYDGHTLIKALSESGFDNISPQEIGESLYPALRNLELHGRRIGVENNRFETMVFEAEKS